VLVTDTREGHFYEAAGWVCDGAIRTEKMAGTSMTETRDRRRL